MNSNKFKSHAIKICYIAYACFFIWLAAQVPYTHDDWDWGLSQGIEQLVSANLNGRYAGNFFVVIMTRSPLLKTLIMGSCYFLIPYLISLFAVKASAAHSKTKQLEVFLFSNLMLFTMRTCIWQQTYGWVSGFANFGISAVFIFVWINEIFIIFSETPEKPRSVLQTVLSVFAALICQLFLENIAIYAVLLSVFICIIHYTRSKRIPAAALLMSAAAIIGLIINFSSSVYDSLLHTGSAVGGYRQLLLPGTAGISDALSNIMNQASTLALNTYTYNSPLCMALMGILFILIIRNKAGSKKGKFVFSAINILIALYFPASFVFRRLAGNTELLILADLLAAIAFFIAVILETVYLFKNEPGFSAKLLTIWISVPLLIAPLVVTNEAGTRLYLSTSIFIILFEALLFERLLESSGAALHRIISVLLIAAVLLLTLYYGMVYHRIGSCKQERDSAIDSALDAGETVITFPAYPHAEYLWLPDPISAQRSAYFKEFYEIPEHIELVFEE